MHQVNRKKINKEKLNFTLVLLTILKSVENNVNNFFNKSTWFKTSDSSFKRPRLKYSRLNPKICGYHKS